MGLAFLFPQLFTVESHYNMVIFSRNTNNRRRIVCMTMMNSNNMLWVQMLCLLSAVLSSYLTALYLEFTVLFTSKIQFCGKHNSFLAFKFCPVIATFCGNLSGLTTPWPRDTFLNFVISLHETCLICPEGRLMFVVLGKWGHIVIMTQGGWIKILTWVNNIR